MIEDTALVALPDSLTATNLNAYGEVVCALCDNEHDVCRFTSGSLRCTGKPCRNPHHRLSLVDYLVVLGVPTEVLDALGVA